MISKESREAIRKMRKKPAFGAEGFDLGQLRQIMAYRREPADKTVRCVPWELNGVPGHWVLAEGADPDVRLLYLHGGGYVSGSGAFYLALAARLAAAAGCAVLLPDYRLAPEHPFPAGLEDCIRAYEWRSLHAGCPISGPRACPEKMLPGRRLASPRATLTPDAGAIRTAPQWSCQ